MSLLNKTKSNSYTKGIYVNVASRWDESELTYPVRSLEVSDAINLHGDMQLSLEKSADTIVGTING